jgi:hypothetical protein
MVREPDLDQAAVERAAHEVARRAARVAAAVRVDVVVGEAAHGAIIRLAKAAGKSPRNRRFSILHIVFMPPA